MKKAFLITALLLISFNAHSQQRHMHKVEKETFYPWSISAADPVITDGNNTQKSRFSSIKTSPFVWLSWMIDMYQLTSSSEPSCTFHPTCSTYTKNAIVKHGAIVGLIMGAERIMRYHHDFSLYELFPLEKVYKLYDPINLNDFWF